MEEDRVQPPSETKPGVKTSEFWITLLGMAAGFIAQAQGTIPEPWGTICATVLGAAYAIARALTKR